MLAVLDPNDLDCPGHLKKKRMKNDEYNQKSKRRTVEVGKATTLDDEVSERDKLPKPNHDNRIITPRGEKRTAERPSDAEHGTCEEQHRQISWMDEYGVRLALAHRRAPPWCIAAADVFPHRQPRCPGRGWGRWTRS